MEQAGWDIFGAAALADRDPDSPSAWSLPSTALGSLSQESPPKTHHVSLHITCFYLLFSISPKQQNPSSIWVTTADEENGFRETRSLAWWHSHQPIKLLLQLSAALASGTTNLNS